MINTSRAKEISVELIAILTDDCGYTIEESIGGLVQAIVDIAEQSHNTEQLLDEASNLLADGGAPADTDDDSWGV